MIDTVIPQGIFFSPPILFLLGLFIGSFLNVVIVRYNTGRTIATGRSMCFSCGRTLAWYELIPVISFVLQGGKCRGCKSKVSWQYPLVEFTTGILFALIAAYLPVVQGSGGELLYYLTVACILVVIAVYDIKHKIIPNFFAYLFAFLALAHLAVSAGSVAMFLHPPYLYTLLAGPAFALPFAALWFVSGGRWIGLGDAKLALGIGWFLGLALGGSAIILSFWIGAAVGVLLIAASRIHARFIRGAQFSLKSEIPFGPFLILGTLIVLFTHFNLFEFNILTLVGVGF